MEQAVERENRVEALRAVVRNGGSPGIDRMTVKELKEHVAKHWESIREKLLAGNYTPSPVKRVDIPKPGGGTRMLGIPTVMDRFVQQLLLGVLQPIFEPRFSEHSYGFRPGRGAHDAIKAAQKYVQEGKEWVVDIDISKFFDHVNHDILMAKIGAVIRDKRVMRLIGRYLRAGIMSEGVVVAREEGTPQGGPLSPMLANVYLDALDKELEGRGLGFCRYADDCNIYVGSQQAAQRVMEKIVGWIEEKLRLKVNPDKSAAGKVWERKFLGFRINPEGQIEVAPQSLQRFKDKVRKLWRSCQSLRSVELRERWCAFVRGWWGYFRQAEATRPVFSTRTLDSETDAQMLLAALARQERAQEETPTAGYPRPGAQDRFQRSGSLAGGQDSHAPSSIVQQNAPPLRLLTTIRARGPSAAGFNRRMLKTACPVVWEGHGAQSP